MSQTVWSPMTQLGAFRPSLKGYIGLYHMVWETAMLIKTDPTSEHMRAGTAFRGPCLLILPPWAEPRSLSGSVTLLCAAVWTRPQDQQPQVCDTTWTWVTNTSLRTGG